MTACPIRSFNDASRLFNICRSQEHPLVRGGARSVVDNANAWLLNNKRLDRRHDRSAGIIQSLLTTTCIFDIANRTMLRHLA